MSLQQRLDEIRRILRAEKRVVVSELSRQFDVTDETIRRDLEKLENEGIATRTYGGAILNQETTTERVDFDRRALRNTEAKREIAMLVSEVIPPHTTVCADASSTVAEALKLLGDHDHLTVLTYSIKAIENLAGTDIELISTGGIINRNTSSFKGPVTKRILEYYHSEYGLISCRALNMDGGIYDSNEEEVELKESLIRHSARAILLVDSTKFDKRVFVHLAGIERLYMLITDKKPSQSWCDYLEEKGVRLLYPGKDKEEPKASAVIKELRA